MGHTNHTQDNDVRQPNDGPNNEDENTANEDTVWAASQGYTPLLNNDGNEPVLFHDVASGVVFSAGPSMMQQAFGGMENGDDEDNSWSSSSDDLDFEALAGTALSNLERDYQATFAFSHASSPETATEPSHNQTANVNDDDKKTKDNAKKERFEPEQQQDKVSDDKEASPTHTDEDASAQFPATDFCPLSQTKIDVSAVAAAVSNLQTTNPKLQDKFQLWQQQQQQTKNHALIPQQPLKAFVKETPKAKTASAHLSRSATIVEALIQLNWFSQETNTDTLRIHVLGCDGKECASVATLQRTFGPCVRWILGHNDGAPRHIDIHLVGPNIIPSACLASVNLLPHHSTVDHAHLQSAMLECHSCLYEDYWNNTMEQQPDLCIAFNAGIWGYDSWKPTLLQLSGQNVPFVITAYTLAEAEEDYETIRTVALPASSQCLWEPTPNPYGSRLERETISNPNVYRENSAWQCWKL